MTLAIGSRLGPYEILSPLGAGGMGEVYRARDSRLDRDVAVKVLPSQLSESPEALARFEREAKAVAALSHSNVVALYDFGSSEGTLYAVTELLEGETLRARLAEGALPARKAVEIAAQVATGLAAAHDKGIVHRDLKPENIFLTKAGPAKILDFGLARQSPLSAAGDDTHSPTVARATDPGTVLGTVGYMSPEQVRGKLADHRSDIFSFGCVLYEMASGRRAFQRESPVETMAAIAREDPPELTQIQPGLPPGLERVVRHCLEKDPEERFQSARDLAFDLASGSSVSAPQEALPDRGLGVRRRWVAVGAGLIAFALGIAGDRWWARNRAPQPSGASSVRFRPLTDSPGEESSPRLSPDGQTLLYVSKASGNLDIYSVRVGGRNATNLTADSKDDDWGPALSADGQQIAFRSERGGGGIFAMGATGESVRRLTDFGYDPSWSPDGKRIVVASEGIQDPYNRLDVSQLWVVTVADGSRRLLAKGDAVQPAWSPDGTRIVFWSLLGEGRPKLRTIRPEGGDSIVVAEGGGEPAWSGDGRFLYFSSERSGPMNLWRLRVDPTTGTVQGQPEPVPVPASTATSPSLSRSGALAYVSWSSSTTFRHVPFDASRGTVAGPAEDLWSSTQSVSDARLAPDGASLVMMRWGSGVSEDIAITRLDGSAMRLLTDDAYLDRAPRFSPDGSRVAFFSNRSGRPQIWEIRVDGSGLRQLPLEGRDLYYPVYAPDGRRLQAVDEKGSSYLLDLTRPDSKWTPLHGAAPGEPLVDAITSWSNDGRLLAGDFVDRGFRAIGVFLQSAETGERHRLTDSGSAPLLLPDGRRLLYFCGDAICLLDTTSGRTSQVVPALKTPRSLGGFDLARDATSLLLIERVSQSDVWLRTEK